MRSPKETKPEHDYGGAQKTETRRVALSSAIQNLVNKGFSPAALHALILVDGKKPQASDVEVLEQLGLRRPNITAISRCWDKRIRSDFYRKVDTVEDHAEQFLRKNDGKKRFSIVYLDYCKPLLNEKNERQASCLFNLFRHCNLTAASALILTHNIDVYFQTKDETYRPFMLRYGSSDYYNEGNYSCISVRAFAPGPMFMGDKLFFREGFFEQKVRILMCFMDGFVRDMAEVYVPHAAVRFEMPDLLAEMEQMAPGSHDPALLPEEMKEAFKMKNVLYGRMGQCIKLLKDSPEKYRKEIEPFSGTMSQLQTAAGLAEWFSPPTILKSVYRPKLIGAKSYLGGRKEETNMLTLAWSVDLMDEVSSHVLWGMPQSRR